MGQTLPLLAISVIDTVSLIPLNKHCIPLMHIKFTKRETVLFSYRYLFLDTLNRLMILKLRTNKIFNNCFSYRV